MIRVLVLLRYEKKNHLSYSQVTSDLKITVESVSQKIIFLVMLDDRFNSASVNVIAASFTKHIAFLLKVPFPYHYYC